VRIFRGEQNRRAHIKQTRRNNFDGIAIHNSSDAPFAALSGHAAALLLFETGVSAMGLSGCHHLFF
jgi:mevalonate pyrophosphate decarboxylase